MSWLLWSPVTETALIVIPEEAELLIPILRDTLVPVCFLLTYAAPITRKMLVHFNDLKYYAIPPIPKSWVMPIWLTVQLGIFSGALYFDFSQYEHLRGFLGFETDKSMEMLQEDCPEEKPHTIDGSNIETNNEKDQKRLGFTAKPQTFLQEWLSVRRKGQDFSHTPMGYVCQGKSLTESHPFFGKNEPGIKAKLAAQSRRRGMAGSKVASTRNTYDDDIHDDWADMNDENGVEVGEESDSDNYDQYEDETSSASVFSNSDEGF